MDYFLDDLHFFCTECAPPSEDPDYKAGVHAMCEMDEQIEQALGKDFFLRYDEACYQVRAGEYLESFRAGLRFGMELALALWGHSSQSPAPRRFSPAFTSPQE